LYYPGAKTVILLVGMVILLAGCGVNPSAAPPNSPVLHDEISGNISSARPQDSASSGEATHVVIDNFAYSPREITVAPGSRVLWVNRDEVPHTVTSTTKSKLFDSGALDGEESFAFIFQAPGIYDYFCVLHPHMTGRIIVK
jgi:plastocyanin